MIDMPDPSTPATLDVVIIGSGFGGSIAANRLALAGQQVMVLERGPWRDSVPVRSMGVKRRAPFPYGWKAITHFLRSLHFGRWSLNFNKSAMYELFSYPGLSVLAASAVGGGSTAFGGLMEAPRDPRYWHARHPALDPRHIEKFYTKVLADMGAVRLSRDHCLPQSVWTQLTGNEEHRCLPAKQQPHMAMLLPRSPDEIGQSTLSESGVERRFCAFDGDSFLGSRGGAKASVDFVYLAPVLGKGATVRDRCEVTRIQRAGVAGDGSYVVQFTDLATQTKEVVTARRVIVAAGTMNTLRLLFKSSTAPDGLAPMPALGRTFGANGDLVGAWCAGGEQVSSFNSPPSLGAFEVEGHDSPTFGMGGLPGIDTLPLTALLKRQLKRWNFIYGIGVDSGRTTVGFRKGRLCVNYDQHQEPVFADSRVAFRVLEAETKRKVRVIGKPLTVHQWGGACLGPDAEHGVIDHCGEVYGNPGLFIADGSALPAAVGGPPSLTIAAWAHHVADGIAASSPTV
jgi:cholesterol oxidase